MTCATAHDHVVASGTCAACRLPVQLTGPLPTAGRPASDELLWLAPPFGHPEASATCRATGDLHTVEHAKGACATCSAAVEAIEDPDNGGLWWFET